MRVRAAVLYLILGLALSGCAGPTATRAVTSPGPTGTAATLPETPSSSPLPVPPPSLMCPGGYVDGHRLIVASGFSQAGYSSLDILDLADPLAPTLVCTINNAPYPSQPVQWLSRNAFVLVANGQPRYLLRVDLSSRTITNIRQLADTTYLAVLSPDRALLATMDASADGTRFARLHGAADAKTLATYPPMGGHGGTIYGFGGPTIAFSPDGTLVAAVDYAANFADPTVPDLQVFDLHGSLVFSAAKGTWAVWVNTSLYYAGGDGKVYKWTKGIAPAVVMQSDWLEPAVSPDWHSMAYLAWPANMLGVLETRSGNTRPLQASGRRLDPLFVTSTLVWASELVDCGGCYGGNDPTGKVFAYDVTTGIEREVRLPALLSPLAGASLSPDA